MIAKSEIAKLRGREVVLQTEEGDWIFGQLGKSIQTHDGIDTITFSNPDFRSLYNDKYAKYENDGWKLDNSEKITHILSLRQWQAEQPDEAVDMSGGDKGLNLCIARMLPQYKKDHPGTNHQVAFENVKEICLRQQDGPSRKKLRGGGGDMRKHPRGSFFLLITGLPRNKKTFDFLYQKGYNWTNWSEGDLFDYLTMEDAQDALENFLQVFPRIKWRLTDVAPTRNSLYEML